MRRLLNEVAHAAATSKGTHFQAVFRSSFAMTRLKVSHMGNRSSPLPRGLKDPARGCRVHRVRCRCGAASPDASSQVSGQTTWKVRVRSASLLPTQQAHSRGDFRRSAR